MADFSLKAWAIHLLIGWTGVVTVSCSSQPSVKPTPSASIAVPQSSVSPVQSSDLTRPSLLPSPSVGQSGAPSPTPVEPDPTLLTQIKTDLSKKVAIAKQDTGKTYLSGLLLSEQAEKLVQGRFTSDLKRLAPDIPVETDEYRLEVRQANAAQAVIVAIAKQPGFSSYTGVVYAVEGKIPMTGICKTNVPSLTPPPPPKRVNTAMMCSSGSSAAN